jgi:hypothetical protein
MSAEQEGSVRRKTVRVGRRFAGTLAARLDAHPGAADAGRIEDEKQILAMMRDVLSQPEPDACAVSFLTHAVEVHTEKHGFSRTIHDELFKLHRARIARRANVEVAKTAQPAKSSAAARRFVKA